MAKDLNKLSALMNLPVVFVNTPDGPRDAATLPRPAANNFTMSAKAAGKRPAEGPERLPEEVREEEVQDEEEEEEQGVEEEEEEEVQPPPPTIRRGPGRPRSVGGPKKYVPTGRSRGRPRGSKNRTANAVDHTYVDEDE